MFETKTCFLVSCIILIVFHFWNSAAFCLSLLAEIFISLCHFEMLCRLICIIYVYVWNLRACFPFTQEWALLTTRHISLISHRFDRGSWYTQWPGLVSIKIIINTQAREHFLTLHETGCVPTSWQLVSWSSFSRDKRVRIDSVDLLQNRTVNLYIHNCTIKLLYDTKSKIYHIKSLKLFYKVEI